MSFTHCLLSLQDLPRPLLAPNRFNQIHILHISYSRSANLPQGNPCTHLCYIFIIVDPSLCQLHCFGLKEPLLFSLLVKGN